ncbi:hypothetical protein B0I35DRAFT_142487 [Stachybotrys elegans]|uniref:Uncharacterized protein n=1 Tax=Stachybotrys elegans TaxID=80388 RepID=A0A8K0T1G9_9HYPO|nr:hypothetical protein B0I35DRAFT_142487 [Stachybotrys elegans]
MASASATPSIPSSSANFPALHSDATALAVSTVSGPSPTLVPASSQTPSSRSQSRDVNDLANLPGLPALSDGRVRNPVPSKLKGMADNRNGNFGVMHMALTRPDMSERDAAAKRTSESTAAAAKLASKDGYQSIKRSKLAWHPQETSEQRSSMTSVSGAQRILPMGPSASPVSVSTSTQPQAPQPSALPPYETKAEQARLLTLLRTLNPVQVVDQLCKAVAYFGGIPSAPPPANGAFPESSRAHGSGALLIGWMSEIFPQVSGIPDASALSQPAGHPANTAFTTASSTKDGSAPVKRARGRPKGSKSSKVRKDKGLKKSDKLATANAPDPLPSSQPRAPAVKEAGSADLAPTNQDAPQFHTIPSESGHLQTPHSNHMADLSQTPGSANLDSSMMSTPGTKKRGRPKGSKNRPKPALDAIVGGQSSDDPGQAVENPSADTSSPTNQKFRTGPGKATSSSMGAFGAVEQHTQQSVNLSSQQDTSGQPSSHLDLHAPTSDTQPTSQWALDATPPIQPGPPIESIGEPGARKRKVMPPTTDGHQGIATLASDMMSTDEMGMSNASHNQTSHLKRRRTSKDTAQSMALPAMDPQNSAVSMSGSPLHGTGFGGNPRPVPVSHAYDSQASVTSLDRLATSNAPARRMQDQQQQQQPRSDPFNPHQHQQQQQQSLQSPHATGTPVMQQGSNPTPRSRQQHPHPFSGQQQVSNPQQGFFAQQRQSPTQFGQMGNPGPNYVRSLPGKSPQYQQNMVRQSSTDGSNMAGMPRQASISTSRPQQARATTAQHPGGFGGQQSPTSASPPSALGQFPNYGGPSYLDMDYVMNGRGVNDSTNAANAAFPGQLEALADSNNLRDRMY